MFVKHSGVHDLPKAVALHALLQKLLAIRTRLRAHDLILFVDANND